MWGRDELEIATAMDEDSPKDQIRNEVWDTLEAGGFARFPFPPHGRIPNFDGASKAAASVIELPLWEEIDVLKSNPDAPQRPLRQLAIEDGKVVIMAEPRLRSEQPFIRIDPSVVDEPSEAATIGGADTYGEPVTVSELPRVDAIVAGSVAVDKAGRRIGKGEGYSDLEFALLLEYGRIDGEVPVVTTVHECQVRGDDLPTERHDVPVDHIVTPERAISTNDRPSRPTGIDWNLIDENRMAEIPALKALGRGAGST